MGFHWELATMATPVTLPLLKLMKQDATACLHPCGNPNQMAEIRIGCVLSSILSQPKKNYISGANILHQIFQIYYLWTAEAVFLQ